MANELVEQATVIVPDKVLKSMNPDNLGPMAKKILRDESNLMSVSTKGYKAMAERLRAQREQLVEERLLREEMGELEKAEDATKIIRDQDREIDGLQRRLAARDKKALSTTAEPAIAVNSKGSR